MKKAIKLIKIKNKNARKEILTCKNKMKNKSKINKGEMWTIGQRRGI